jgi:AraC family transcriptional regulator of adaptative response/methylated-DNA-[protein]-cysteine methyltransferase
MTVVNAKADRCVAPHEPATGSFVSLPSRWQAVRSRDRRADGHFFLAVRTTGIFCKPSCAARQAKPKNVLFFDTSEEARAAGFRPCKRCRPEETAVNNIQAEVVAAAARLIEAAIEREETSPSLDDLAGRAGYSPFHFHRLFKKVLGLTPKAYANAARSGRLREELAESATITAAIHGAGYSSSSRFYETAGARLGMTPSTHRKGGLGETIRFAVRQCSLGLALVAATDRGICTIQFGDDEVELIERLKTQFRQARFVANDENFKSMVDQVLRLVEAPQLAHDLPLDVRGTAFQERVWQALRNIPAGRTSTYGEIATAIGEPKAARAVAQACGANPTAVAIPCHRVVHSNGDPSGYRWGSERKLKLLKREGAL